VIYLSADALAAQLGAPATLGREGPQRPFYVVRVRLDADSVERQLESFRPTPGMPADVFIRTGERTFFDYLMRPVLDSLSKAFREH
jgi:HlyD family secretion protein